ncbi:MAG TPA: phage tail protein, partial [Verrucomicrobiae bacterium]
MDANGQQFWLVRGGADWQPEIAGSLALNPEFLELASRADGITYPEDAMKSDERLSLVPVARDAFGGRAYYDTNAQTFFGASDLPGAEHIPDMPGSATDLALGFDGCLYIATGSSVFVRDMGGRNPPQEVKLEKFSAWRLAPDPGGGAWVLDHDNKSLARLSGQLWPAPLAMNVPPSAFLPVEQNPNPFRLTPVSGPWLEVNEDPVAIACSPAGRLAVLLWTANPSNPAELVAKVRLVTASGATPRSTATLNGISRPFSLAWISEERFAVITPGVGEAVVYAFADGTINATGEIFPLRDHDGGPFTHGVSLPVEYMARQPTDKEPERIAPRPLIAVSLPAFPASARGTLNTPLDSNTAGTAWHRFYVEAMIPPETSFTLEAAATDEDKAPEEIAGADWHPHHFGAPPPAAPFAADATDKPPSPHDREPLAAWVPARSEIPGFNGFLPDAPEKNRAGLFTVLIQRARRPVRTLRGRFLHLRITLRGDARATPCIHALRAYAPRFSYQEKYLPALYREQEFGPEADRVATGRPSTRADFLGRFLANFEGVLTPLEDRIAGAWLLTEPRKAPDEALGWLGSWIGVAFEPWFPAERRRELLRRAPELFGRRGTLDGLRLALDVATGGGVLGDHEGRRRIVVVEDYWMRRTLATVLGVNLDREFDPLFGGPTFTGNSKVGRTLFITEGIKREVLALFDAAIRLNPADQAMVDEFFASLAHRATVIVHETVGDGEFGLIGRVAALEAPAHTIVRVRRASQDFMVGLAALLGVDT